MSVSTTQLLLLGAVGLFEPVNGYQIRRELESWRVGEWASIKRGSIYHGLGRLADQGLMVSHQLADSGRETVIYELTDVGRAELEAGVVEAIVEVNVFDRHAFQAAFGLLPMVGADRAADALRGRRDNLRDAIAGMFADPVGEAYVPPHALRSLRLWKQFAEVELYWLDGVLDDLASGELSFSPGEWSPPADDPGMQMVRDRERYRTELGRA